ncbi:mitochondrial carrier protein [Nitzschia inconspicua]|uniref:Mitochondrial carrier protein n=1 Tax=Nitzschia inconspicua TaxID=303405 RepID=A0A9K3PYG9_9STRA|nr:mitochondrial carrier protein [Nitzschia inconspicua]
MSNQIASQDSGAEAALSVAISATEEVKSSAGSSLKSFLSGGIGGVCAVLVGHPFDLIKVRMQTGTASSAAGTSVLGTMRQTLAKEGVRGLYRGVSAPLVASTPIYAISFWGYDIGQRLVRMFKSDPNQKLNLMEISFAGGFSALPTTIVMAPTERIKCLLQVQSHVAGKPQYSGMIDCAMQVYRQGGITSLYKGTMLTLMRDVPGSIAWFGTYEIIKRALVEMQGIEDPSQLSPLAVMTAGGFAGMACWGVSIPPDVLKSRFQTAPEGKYNGVFDVYKTLVRTEGYGALFTGFRPAMIRAFPANAACFLGMEVGRKVFAFLD